MTGAHDWQQQKTLFSAAGFWVLQSVPQRSQLETKDVVHRCYCCKFFPKEATNKTLIVIHRSTLNMFVLLTVCAAALESRVTVEYGAVGPDTTAWCQWITQWWQHWSVLSKWSFNVHQSYRNRQIRLHKNPQLRQSVLLSHWLPEGNDVTRESLWQQLL